MAVTMGNFESKKSQLFIESPFIILSNSVFVERRTSKFLIKNINFVAHFAAPCSLSLEAAASTGLPPPNFAASEYTAFFS
jgi:hypothetical protein